MKKKPKEKQLAMRTFFWLIPGDVPAYRTQPDPYSSDRGVVNEGYQLPPHLDTHVSHPTDTIEHNSLPPHLMARESNDVASTAVSESQQTVKSTPVSQKAVKSLSESLQTVRSAGVSIAEQTRDRVADKDMNIPFLILVALLIALFVGYKFIGEDALERVDTSTITTKLTDAITIHTKQDEDKKVLVLSIGEKTKTPESKLRVVIHTVVKGDTLWDIAEKYVKDPFRYPELAELSEIKNPDLIYPYDQVRIHIYE